MNAPVRGSDLALLGDAHDFAECCGTDAWFYSNGWISLHTAVDNLQNLAERWGLIEEIGQDAVQAIMVDAFAPREAEPEIDIPDDYAADLVRQRVTKRKLPGALLNQRSGPMVTSTNARGDDDVQPSLEL